MSLALASLLAESALRHPNRTAVVAGDERITYAELWEQTRRYAAVLRERGVRTGDHVAILMPNIPDFPRAYYGILALGAVVVPIHVLLRAEEVAYALRDSGAKALICAAPLLEAGREGARLAGCDLLTVLDAGGESSERLENLAARATPIAEFEQREPSDAAVILYTSGTTGKPKGAVLTQLNMVMNAFVNATDVCRCTSDDVLLACLPLFHSYGQTSVMNTAFRLGASLVMLARFDADTALDLMVRENVTYFVGVPTMYIALLEAARKNPKRPKLHRATSGGASLPVAVLEEFERVFNAAIYEGYGLSETSPIVTTNQEDFGRKPGSIGCALWGIQVEIADAEVEDRIELLPTGEVGELVVRGHNIFSGYLNNPEATRAAIVDGWFRTGDLATKDAEGFVTIVDRKKDMVLRGGFNVYPREVEEVLVRHPAVAQVAVIGLPDAMYGEEVCAVIVPRAESEIDTEEIIAWSKERLAGHKYPRRVELVETFPLGPSGKVLKRELIARFR